MLKVLPIVLPVMLMVALFTLFESKILASVQSSSGPNVVGIFGLLQPFADAFKLIFKETMMPGLSNLVLFVLAPVFTFTLSLLSWAVIPFNYGNVMSDMSLGLMFIFSMSSLSVYGMIISGWSSNSKYAFLGSLSSAAQFISYEVVMGVMLMVVLMSMGSLNFTNIVNFQTNVFFVMPFWPSLLMFFMAALAETNSVPFDLPEAESELVSGFNVEYAATTFVLFFLSEYSNILMMCCLITMFFLNGWLPFFFFFMPGWFLMSFKVCMVVFFFILMSAVLPRYSYDQLMNLGWKILLPVSFVYFFLVSMYVYLLDVTFVF